MTEVDWNEVHRDLSVEEHGGGSFHVLEILEDSKEDLNITNIVERSSRSKSYIYEKRDILEELGVIRVEKSYGHIDIYEISPEYRM